MVITRPVCYWHALERLSATITFLDFAIRPTQLFISLIPSFWCILGQWLLCFHKGTLTLACTKKYMYMTNLSQYRDISKSFRWQEERVTKQKYNTSQC